MSTACKMQIKKIFSGNNMYIDLSKHILNPLIELLISIDYWLLNADTNSKGYLEKWM